MLTSFVLNFVDVASHKNLYTYLPNHITSSLQKTITLMFTKYENLNLILNICIC